MSEQETNTLAIMRPSNGLSKRRTNIHNPQLITPTLLVLERHGIRDDDAAQLALVEDLDGVAGEDAVGDDGDDFAGFVCDECLGCFG